MNFTGQWSVTTAHKFCDISFKKELARKEKALTETGALLVLGKSQFDLGQGKGRMISIPDRIRTVDLIDQAVVAGARRERAFAELGIHEARIGAGQPVNPSSVKNVRVPLELRR